jgi:DNA modification methylase
MKIELKKLSDLKPAPYNPRQSNAEQEKQLKSSLEKFGVVEPIIFNKQTGFIVGGHFRIRELKKLGYKEIECVIVDLNEADEKELNIRLNANTGSWDWDELANNWDSELLSDWGLEIPGFEPTILEAEEDDFTAPEGGIETDIVLGDLFEIGEHRLLCGDSTQTDTFKKLMQGEMADMVVTDPPYNVAYEGKTKDALKIENDSMGNDDFYKFLYDFYSALTTAVKKGGAIYVWHASSEIINFGKAMVDAGWLLKQQLIWVKNSMVMGRQDYQWKHEPCLYGWLKGDSHKWYSDRKQTTVIEWDRPSRNGEHPTMKPIGLFSYQIENSSKQGDIVIDAFGGSGTTMVACEQLKRKARVIEFDPKYCQVIIDRMKKLDPTIKIKRNGIELK